MVLRTILDLLDIAWRVVFVLLFAILTIVTAAVAGAIIGLAWVGTVCFTVVPETWDSMFKKWEW